MTPRLIATDLDGTHLRIEPKVVDAGHHQRRLLRLTGLDTEEFQARRLLNDLDTGRVYDLTLPGEVRIDTWPAESGGSTPRVWDPMSSSSSPSSTSRPKPSKTSTSAKKKTTKKKGAGAKSPTSTSTKKSG